MADALAKSLIQVTENDFHQMYAVYNLSEKQVKEAREAVIEYCLKQEHLKDAVPFIVNTYAIERALQVSKGSTEMCKKRLETVLTARSFLSEFFVDRTFEEFKLFLNVANYIILPKIIPNELSGVVILQNLKPDLDEDLDILTFFRFMFLMADFRIYYSCHVAERFIIDSNNLPVSFMKMLNPMLIKKAELLATEYYGARLKGIHMLNAPPFIYKVINLMKRFMKPKNAERIYVHKTYEEMHEFIPKEVLPKDYGGYESSCSELADKWKVLLNSEDARQKIKDLEKVVSDESKRLNSKYNEEFTRMSGSFKTLEVD